jgi:hypothetical protein
LVQKDLCQIVEKLQSNPSAQSESAPGLVYFHIPLPEVKIFGSSSIIGIKQ